MSSWRKPSSPRRRSARRGRAPPRPRPALLGRDRGQQRRAATRWPITAAASTAPRAVGAQAPDPRHRRVAHRSRQPPPAASASTTRNGLPPVRRDSSRRRPPVGAGQRPHGGVRQRRKRDAPHRRAGHEVADQQREREVRGQLVVAIGHDDHDAGLLDAPRQQAKHVQRRRIRPMRILEHARPPAPARAARPAATAPARTDRAPCGADRARPPTSSRTGASGTGTDSGSHAPTRNAAAVPDRARSARTSDVLPIPASPATRTSWPRPSRAAFTTDSSAASSWSRSSSGSTPRS